MSATALATLVARCRGLCGPQESDGELLRRFVRQRDAAALEPLVRRYALLVWGVCRRVLPDEADCEDAFQATFLALVRQAGSLDPDQALGGWLHTVAVRVARKALGRGLRRRARAIPADQAAAEDVAADIGSRELLRAVDEEIERLPATLRLPLLLCCLEGRTRDEAAETLGCSVAAVKGRLERGRALLRRRLERRGIALPTAFLVLGLTVSRASAALRARAVEAALGAASPAVAALATAGAVPQAGKLLLAALVLFAAGAVGLGVLRVVQAEAPAQEPQDAPPPVVREAPRDRFGDTLPPGAVRRFGTVRFRHNGIAHLAFTPDGTQLLAGTGHSPLAVFDPLTGRRLREVGKHSPNNIYGFALSPDGKQVANCGFDVGLWELDTGRLVREFGAGRCQAVAFSPDGARLAAVTELRARCQVFTATGERLAQWNVGDDKQYHDARLLSFSPDGKLLVALVSELREEKPFHFVAAGTSVRLWDAAKGEPAGSVGTADDPVYGFAFQPDTGHLAVVGKNGTLRFHDLATRKEIRRVRLADKDKVAFGMLRFSADGRRLAVYRGESLLSVHDAADGKELRRIDLGDTKTSPVTLALSPDGKALAAARYYGESCVRVWDVESGAERLADAGHRGTATLSLSADGRTLISRGSDGRVFHWDLRTGDGRAQPAEDRQEPGRPVWSMSGMVFRGPRWQLHYDWSRLALEARSADGAKVLRKVKLPATHRGFAVSPAGTHLAFAVQDPAHTVLLWDPEHEDEPRSLRGHPDACQQMLFTHDGKRLIAGAGTHNAYPSETVWVWDVATAKVLRKLATNSAPGHLVLTADDRTLLTGGLWNDGAVQAWDVETGRLLATLTDPSLKLTSEAAGKVQSHLGVTGLALSPDERFVAVVTSSGATSALCVWETGTWRLVRAFAPCSPRNEAGSIISSHDGRSVFVANSDSTILEWSVAGPAARKTEAPDKARLDALWQALAQDPATAYAAAWELVDHPAEAVPFLKEKVAPAQATDGERLRRLVAQLDAESFAEREEATRRLLAAGEAAAPALREALKAALSQEAKRRAERLLEAVTAGPTPDEQRMLRVVAVLEWSGRADADGLLRRLAGGASASRLTRAAKAALMRRER